MDTTQVVYIVTEELQDGTTLPDRAFTSMREARDYSRAHENRWWTPVELDQYKVPI